MRQPKRIYLSPPHLGDQELRFVEEVFASNWIAPLGPQVDAFEREIAEYVRARMALAVNSGTSALHLALRYLKVGWGDFVFCSTLTFVASANPILYQGATPVFIDSDADSWNMSPAALEQAFAFYGKRGKRPKAVIVVHLYGQNAKMLEIMEICNRYNVPVIEDAAESLGASSGDKWSGTMGKFGIYSFNGNKMLTTSGGGMVVSDDIGAIEKMRYWATQARHPSLYYEHSEIGYNYRLSNVLAAIGRGQLAVLDERIDARRNVFKRYYSALSAVDGISFMPELQGTRSTRWLTALTVHSERVRTKAAATQIIAALAKENIEARPVWKPMHLQPLYRRYPYFPHGLHESVSDLLFQQGVCLPSGSNLSEQEQDRVIAIVKLILNGSR